MTFTTKHRDEESTKELVDSLFANLEGRNRAEISDDRAFTNGNYKNRTIQIKAIRDELIKSLEGIR